MGLRLWVGMVHLCWLGGFPVLLWWVRAGGFRAGGFRVHRFALLGDFGVDCLGGFSQGLLFLWGLGA